MARINSICRVTLATSLLLAQVLAGIGTNGINLGNIFGSIGKREVEARGPIIDNLFAHASDLVSTQVKPLVEGAINGKFRTSHFVTQYFNRIHLSGAILNLAAALANFSQNGFGRR
jgi:hypothetical protein